jgi:putative aldouronate transport system substrate-binding protein
MQYMNFMYTSSEWNELFKWGEKDVDFEEIDGTAKFKEDAEYNHALQWLAPGQFLAMPEYGNPSNIWDVYTEFNNNAIVSEASGFSFDKTPVANEYTALTNVYSEYQKSIEYGMVDSEAAIAEMEEKLKAAGYETYMAEKQSQLDAWRVANGK